MLAALELVNVSPELAQDFIALESEMDFEVIPDGELCCICNGMGCACCNHEGIVF